MFNRFLGAVLAAAAIFVACADASAHVVLDVREAKAGSYFEGVFRVGHGCAGSPTIRVAVTIPDGINSARPQPKPGWDIEIVKRKLEAPREIGHGRQIDEVVSEIVWKGGPLPNAYFDEFAIQMRLPDRAENGVIHFPVRQACESGANNWVEVPAPDNAQHAHHHGLKFPAPALHLIPKP